MKSARANRILLTLICAAIAGGILQGLPDTFEALAILAGLR